jgi:hypothetical protein
MTGLTVRSIDLNHPNALLREMSGEAGTIRAGPLNTDQADGSEPAKPPNKVSIAAGGGVERFDTEDTSVRIHGGGDVEVEVGVDTASDGDCSVLYDGHCHPFQ